MTGKEESGCLIGMAEYIDKNKLENYAMNCVGGCVDIMQIHNFPVVYRIPDGHGRLIDADVLRAEFKEPHDWSNINEALCHITGIWAEIDAAETIIPADKETSDAKNM